MTIAGKALFVAFSVWAISPSQDVLAQTCVWSRAEVWAGVDEYSLDGDSISWPCFFYAHYTYNDWTVVSGKTVTTRCIAECESGYTTIKVRAGILFRDNSFPYQYARAAGGFTNLIGVAGPLGTGSVVYTVKYDEMFIGFSPGVSCANSLSVKHNGDPVEFPSLNVDWPQPGSYESEPIPLVFGQVFTQEAFLASQLGIYEQLEIPGDVASACRASIEIGMKVLDSFWNEITDESVITKTSMGGSPYPQGPRLFFNQSASAAPQLSWHSLLAQDYQLQKLADHSGILWSNLGAVVSGVGSTNRLDIETSEHPIGLYRIAVSGGE
jgi:hypothetical protein